jgi:hypothetical protein
MTAESKPTRRGTIWLPAGGEGTTVYEPETDGLHVLNVTALAIWELCDGATEPEEMALAISELTGIGVEEAARDVTATLERLQGLGLIS